MFTRSPYSPKLSEENRLIISRLLKASTDHKIVIFTNKLNELLGAKRALIRAQNSYPVQHYYLEYAMEATDNEITKTRDLIEVLKTKRETEKESKNG